MPLLCAGLPELGESIIAFHTLVTVAGSIQLPVYIHVKLFVFSAQAFHANRRPNVLLISLD